MLKNLPPIFSIILLCVASWYTFYSTQPKDINREKPEIEFSTTRAFKHVEAIARKPHFTGSEQQPKVRNYIVNQLQDMGLQVETHEAYVLNKNASLVRPQNILSRIEGSGEGEALVLMTHYDSNPHSSLGAADAGSGVAAILEGMRAFLAKNEAHINDIIILFTDAEEIGLMGAELFVKDHPWAKDIGLALNFESRGSGGDSFMFLETNSGNAGLIKEFKQANPEFPVTNSLVYSVYKMLPNDTDLTVLREQANINGFNFAFIDNHFDYHTATDTPKNLDKESLAHQGSYLMTLLHHFKDNELSQTRAKEEVVFFSLPGGEIISYPFKWNYPLLLVALILFIGIAVYGFFTKKLQFKSVFNGLWPYAISLSVAGLLVYGLWQFCLYIYPEYGEILQGFPYNGYYYLTAFIFLGFSIAFFTYNRFHKNSQPASQFTFPLFFWLMFCGLLSVFLPGGAYFIIPLYFGLLQWFIMLRQKRPSPLWMAFLSLPALFILLPFIKMFPVALGLKIGYLTAILCVLLFTLLIPVFGYFRRKKALALLAFILFNIFFFTAHFKSGFTEERPKPNSLVYLYDADENSASWHSYDKMPDKWTEKFFGKEPVEIPSETKTFNSKYNTGFTWKAEAPEIDLKAPTAIFDTLYTSEKSTEYSLKIVSNRNVHRLELFAEQGVDFEKFEVNGLKADSVKLGQQEFHVHTRRWHERLLTYQVSSRDTLRIKFSLENSEKPEFILYESSYDLLKNPELNVPKRPKTMIPKPFVLNDVVIFKKTLSIE